MEATAERQAISMDGRSTKGNEPATVPIKRIGLVRVGTGNDVAALEALDRQMAQPTAPQLDRLSTHLGALLQKAKDARQQSGVDAELLESLYAREGEYTPGQLSILSDQNEPDVFEPLTGDIIVNAVSWIEDMLNLPHGEIYKLDASPLPEMPEEITNQIVQGVMQKAVQHAQSTGMLPSPDEMYSVAGQIRSEVEKQVKAAADDAAERMNRLIDDQFSQGDFYLALADVIEDMATYPSAWLKGPVVQAEEDLAWESGDGGPQPVLKSELKPKWYSPSPFDMFPSPGCTKRNEGYVFERMRMEGAGLSAFRSVPGFNADAIDAILSDVGRSGYYETDALDNQRARLERRQSTVFLLDGIVEVYSFNGKLQGSLLMEWGYSKKLDPNTYYPVVAWMCRNRVFMVRPNTNPRGDWEYSCASYERRKGSIWGKGVAQVVGKDQKKANGYRRSAETNASQAAGFQTMVDVSRLAEGERVTNPHPGKVWQTTSGEPGSGSNSRPPVEFFQPHAIFTVLEKHIDDTRKRADERAGIPPYAYGSDRNRGAADTVGGLSILMNNSAKGLRKILRELDRGIIKTAVFRQWVFNMLFHDDPSVKGDIEVVPRGALGQVVKEGIFLRRQEFLNMTANPFDMKIIGVEGRRTLLEEQEGTLDLPANSVVPTREKLEEKLKAELEQAQAQQPPPPVGDIQQ